MIQYKLLAEWRCCGNTEWHDDGCHDENDPSTRKPVSRMLTGWCTRELA